jgi:hypothetical protein
MDDFTCVTWFERDRRYISLGSAEQPTIFELWDDDVIEAVEDGYLPTPRVPRPTDDDWLPCAVAYAEAMNLIPRSQS